MTIQKVYLVTDYPTLNDPHTQYALGLIVAVDTWTAKIRAIQHLASGGLDLDMGDGGEITLSEWDTTVPGVQLFYS